MTEVKLKANIRSTTGTGSSRFLRAGKEIPAVVYGQGMDPLHIALPETEVNQLLNKGSAHALLDLRIGRKKYAVMIKEIQRNHLKGNVIHLDLHSVNLKEPVQATVTVHLEGESPGVKAGGILQHMIREVEVKCLPTDVPSRFDLDISGLQMGDNLTAAAIAIPSNVELLTPTTETIVSILAPRLAEEPVAEETDEADEEPTAEEQAE